jgi:hypothetical protein
MWAGARVPASAAVPDTKEVGGVGRPIAGGLTSRTMLRERRKALFTCSLKTSLCTRRRLNAYLRNVKMSKGVFWDGDNNAFASCEGFKAGWVSPG